MSILEKMQSRNPMSSMSGYNTAGVLAASEVEFFKTNGTSSPSIKSPHR